MSRRQTVIALGSNIGNSTATIVAAAKRVGTLPGTKLMALSTVCTSRPAVVLEQPDFKNAVMLIETDIEPRELLRCLQEIEREFGRVTSGTDYLPSGPRTLDLDIIDMEGIVMHDPHLTLPHPEALYRDFVVRPLLEISPHHVLANQKVVGLSQINCGEICNAVQGESSVTEQEAGREAAQVSGQGAGQKNEFAALAQGGVAGSPNLNAACLSLCATPIGNLGDITLRVLEALMAADVIYCEDTRVTRKLTARYGINTPLRRADAHALPQILPSLLNELAEGKHLAYVSDAGTPGISDPGGLLVAAVREAGFTIEVLPGASALTTALAVSGIKAHNCYFGGYFPRKTGAGKRLLESLASLEDTVLVFYESVHRTAKTLQLIAELFPNRHVVMARELTKLHEEILSGTAASISTQVNDRISSSRPLKGEVVLLLAPVAT